MVTDVILRAVSRHFKWYRTKKYAKTLRWEHFDWRVKAAEDRKSESPVKDDDVSDSDGETNDDIETKTNETLDE